MVSFDAKVVLSGLCAYVPDEDLNDPCKKIKMMRVVMPEAGAVEKKRALDRRKFRRHYPHLIFNSRVLKDLGSMPRGERILWDLSGHELSFDIDEEVSGLNEVKVVQDFKPFNDPTKSPEDFNWGLHVKDAAPNFSKINPGCFYNPKTEDELKKLRELVSARVIIDKGRLSTHALRNSRLFRVSAVLDGGIDSRPMSSEVALNFYKLRSLTITATPFGNPRAARSLVLTKDGGELELTLGNLCDNCLFPARRDEKEGKKDKDFRWLYELCLDAQEIPPKLGRRSLPIPELVGGGRGGGLRAVECMRLSFSSYKPAMLSAADGEEVMENAYNVR